VRVAEELATAPSYNIDLTREDAIFHVAAGLDASRIQVTCPTLAALEFADYVEIRIRPTGSKYDPNANELWLANGAVSEQLIDEAIGRSTRGLSTAAASQCVNVCVDDADGNETCVCRGGDAAE
jgi:hypothetical protein